VAPTDRTVLLEREADLARLTATVEGVRSGSGAVVVLEGPAGIGKTRLLEATRAIAATAGLAVLSARPGELEQELGWAMVRELFEPRLKALSVEERDGVLSGAARLALPALGHLDEATPIGGTDGLAAALHGLYWVTANLSELGPLLIAVDDAHWADEPSRRWLAYMAARVEDLPVVLAVTARPAEPGATPDLVGALAGRGATVVLRPAPLTPDAATACIRDALGERAETGFCRACVDVTGGNPFLLLELLGELVRTGVVPVDVNAEQVRQASPESIGRAALGRIGRLGPDALRLAAALAVLGTGTQLRHAALLSGLDEQAAARAADQLAEADVLGGGLPLDFIHPLVRTAVYERQPMAQLALRHGQAARLLAAAGSQDDAIAPHLLAVEPTGDPELVARLRHAAELVLARGAPSVAATYLRRALAEPPAATERSTLTHRLGHAETAAMEATGLDTLERALDLCDDPAEHATIAIEFARSARMVGDFPRATRALERAAGGLEPGAPLATSVDGELIGVAMTDLATSADALQRLARYLDPAVLGRLRDAGVLANLGLAGLSAATVPRAACVDLARRAVTAMAPDEADISTIDTVGSVLMFCDEFDDARALWEKLIARARATGSALTYGFGICSRAMLANCVGDVAEAEEDARTAVAIFAEWGTRTAPHEVVLCEALIDRGALHEADERLGSDAAEELDGSWDKTDLLYTRGRLRLAQGRPQEALADLRVCGRRLASVGARNPTVLPWRSLGARALAQLGQHDEAHELAEEELELARSFGAARALGVSLCALGTVEGGEAGLELLGEAVDVLSGSDARGEHAHALCDLGAALRRSGRRADARAPLRQALDLATRTGASLLADRARDELVAAGARPRRDRIEGRDALTASERRVATLAKDGLSNPEIAQSLFVTRRTVETHLTHIYRKLDIASRADLAAALAGAA
jgi:DNA-binding CsgD family transcriptional regulator/Flp pilus assembly protein TadD